MRVRKGSKYKHPARFMGKFPSLKLNRTVLWGSQLVRDYLYMLEFDVNVLSYSEQPLVINHVLGSLPYKYTPDFLVERSNKRQIIEIMPEDQLDEAGTGLYRSIYSACRQKGYDFLIVTDKVIQMQPRLSNIKLLLKYARTPISPQHQILCAKFIGRNSQATFGEMVQFFESHGTTRQVVYALMYAGEVIFDLMQPIGFSTKLRSPAAALVHRKAS